MVASEDDTLEDARLARRVAAPPDPEADVSGVCEHRLYMLDHTAFGG